MKRRLGSGRISPPAGFEPATPWSEVGSANHSATLTLPHEERLGPLATRWAHSEDWSDWADTQADLSLRWAHTHFVGFVMSRLICA